MNQLNHGAGEREVAQGQVLLAQLGIRAGAQAVLGIKRRFSLLDVSPIASWRLVHRR